MFANLITRNERDSRTDSVNDKQYDQALKELPLTMEQLSWVGGGQPVVNII